MSNLFAMRILLQFPEGLKQDALRYIEKYENEGHEVILSGEPIYGACDIPPLEKAKLLRCDKIVHFGHTKFMNIADINVEYAVVPADIPIEGVLKAAVEEIKKHKEHKKIGLITNASHLHQVEQIKTALSNAGFECITAKGSARCDNECQILGCDVTALNSIRKNVDCVVYFGAGQFHAFAPGAMEKSELPPILWVDPYSHEIKWINDELKRIQKIRQAAIARASNACVFGILVSTKAGQYALDSAEIIKAKIENSTNKNNAKKRKAVIIVSDTFDFTALNNFTGIECWVNTACPRIVDDQNKLRAPIINASDVEVIL
ncbi:MAG: diphthamide biosynthesis enzyme Dph2 [Candidatus Micrarchaeia archaeon]